MARGRCCFNPRARVGRDIRLWQEHGREIGVSIHAPEWGATRPDTRKISCGAVSIHAPAWGATIRGGPWAHGEIVSIHAPAWGATWFSAAPSRPESGFNPRARVGRDPRQSLRCTSSFLFQSTRPRGARRFLRCARVRHSPSFNPRARVGRDDDVLYPGRAKGVSIHAPAWGAT